LCTLHTCRLVLVGLVVVELLLLHPQEWWRSIVMSMSVYVCEHISGTTRAIFTNFSVHVAYGYGSVLLRHGDELPREGAILGVVQAFQKHWQSFAAKGSYNGQ